MSAPGSPDSTGISIDTDKSRLDLAVIHGFLTTSYWAKGISVDVVRRSIENSLCFGMYQATEQVGFARVISDFATFAYLADVFVLESHRGRGLSKVLTAAVLAHPHLQRLRRFVLATRDAHGLYSQFGFMPADPSRFMERYNPNVYTGASSP